MIEKKKFKTKIALSNYYASKREKKEQRQKVMAANRKKKSKKMMSKLKLKTINQNGNNPI